MNESIPKGNNAIFLVGVTMMIICVGIWTVSTFLTTALAASLDNFRKGATFSLKQIPIDSPDSSIAEKIRAPYFKFSVEIPADLEDAISRDEVPGQTSVATKPVNYDQAYGSFTYSLRRKELDQMLMEFCFSYKRTDRKSNTTDGH